MTGIFSFKSEEHKASGFENEIIEKRISLAVPVRKEVVDGKRSDFGFTCFLKYDREYSFCNL